MSTTVEVAQKKLSLLPIEAQLQILDYINFMLMKYEIEEDEELLKAFLLKRAEEVEQGKKRSFNEYRKEMYRN